MPARLEAINNDLQHRREAKTRGGETMGLAGAFEAASTGLVKSPRVFSPP